MEETGKQREAQHQYEEITLPVISTTVCCSPMFPRRLSAILVLVKVVGLD